MWWLLEVVSVPPLVKGQGCCPGDGNAGLPSVCEIVLHAASCAAYSFLTCAKVNQDIIPSDLNQSTQSAVTRQLILNFRRRVNVPI